MPSYAGPPFELHAVLSVLRIDRHPDRRGDAMLTATHPNRLAEQRKDQVRETAYLLRRRQTERKQSELAPSRSRQQRVGRERFANQRGYLSDHIVADGSAKDFVDVGQSGQFQQEQSVAVSRRRVPRYDGAYRLGEVLAIRQPGQRIIASRRMSLTLKAGQLFACITERARNAEKHHPRQNERQRRKRHHTDDEAPSLRNKVVFARPAEDPKDFAFQTAFPGPGQRKYGQQGQRKNRAYACTRQGHRNSSPSSLTDGARTIAMSGFSLETAPDGEHIAQKHLSEQRIILW